MLYVWIFATLAGPVLVLHGLYTAARARNSAVLLYVTFALGLGALVAGAYLIGMVSEIEVAQSSTRWFSLRYTLGLGLMIAGGRIAWAARTYVG